MPTLTQDTKAWDTEISAESPRHYQYGYGCNQDIGECSVMQYSAVQCSAMQWSSGQKNEVHCTAVQCSAVQCNAMKFKI